MYCANDISSILILAVSEVPYGKEGDTISFLCTIGNVIQHTVLPLSVTRYFLDLLYASS